MRLTDLSVRNLPVPERSQKLYFDDAIPGFAVRVSQGGARSFILQVRNPRRLITLGRYHPQLFTLAAAREKARDILARKQLGQDAETEGTPFPAALEQFLDAYRRKNKPSTVQETERLIRRYLPFTGDIATITIRDINRVVDKIEKPSERLHAFVAAKTLFNWFAKRRMILTSPMAGVEPPHRSMSRERVLTDTELVVLWRTLDKLTDLRFANICRLLILTGQRLAQIGGLHADYIDYENKIIVWPGSVMKSGRQHHLPYGPMVAAILEELPKQSYLFPTRKQGVYTNWSVATTRLRKLCLISHFTLHDCRRSWATKAAEWGIAEPHIIERVLAHQTGTISGVAAIYNRATYLPAIRATMEAFEAKLSALLNA
jgi:integrase